MSFQLVLVFPSMMAEDWGIGSMVDARSEAETADVIHY